jgi:EmrB/QacA subfamily drug resistance transporter
MPEAHANPHHARRWLILFVIAIAQLMVVLDATVVNIALPSAQKALNFSDDQRQWIVTAYALAFGSLLLLGGRIGDLFGRKLTFVVGLGGFAGASALGGFAGSFEVLVAARALQGVFGALLAPAALSVLTTTFTEPDERGKAFGIFGAVAVGGAAIGLILGGLLTQYLNWRWCLYVNLAFAVPAALAAMTLLHNEVAERKPRLDIPGAITATAGLFALVYGLANAQTHSWGDATTVGMLVAGVALLAGFVVIQRRSRHPLLPLRVVLDRDRGGSFLAMALSGAGVFGVFLFLTYYMQQTLGFSPVKTGLAFLPMTFAIVVSATSASCRGSAPGRSSAAACCSPRAGWRSSPASASTRRTRRTSCRACSWSAPVSASCSARRWRRPRSVSSRATPASPRRWSTRCSRSAARSARRCSARSPRRP